MLEKLKLGDQLIISKTLKRIYPFSNIRGIGRREYEEQDIEPKRMMYIGYRTGSQGRVDELGEYLPNEFMKYALFIPSVKLNPIKVPWNHVCLGE